MIPDMWQRLKKRHERVLSEVAETHVQLAREGKLLEPPPLLPRAPAKNWVIVVFWITLLAVISILWFLMKGGAY